MTEAHDALFLAAHPDDVEICCAGTILRLLETGKRIALVDMTRGEKGTRGTAETRQAECDAATQMLGAHERVNLQLPDAEVRDDDVALAAVVGAIRRLRPRLFFAQHVRDVHPDHVATAQVVRRAFFHSGLANFRPDLGAAFRPGQLIHFQGNDHIDPTFCVDITGYEDKKRAIVECYATQVNLEDGSHFAKKMDPLERCEARDRYFGAQVGCRAAEPFFVDGPFLVRDLGELF